MFDAVDQVCLALAPMTGMIATATFDTERMQAAADAPALAATDLAEWLVAAGTPFRDAHALVGALVRESLVGRRVAGELVGATPASGPTPPRSSRPAWPSAGAPPRAAPARCRCRSSSSGFASGWRPTSTASRTAEEGTDDGTRTQLAAGR